MSTFAIGDIHGGLKALLQVLNKLALKEDDTLVFMGDYVDGWSEAAQVVEFLMELSEKSQCIFIKGNHDVLCEDWLKNDHVDAGWYLHGGKETIDSYEAFTVAKKEAHLLFFSQMKMYHLDAESRLFLHAGFTSLHGVEKEAIPQTLCTDRTLWELALAMQPNLEKHMPRYPKRFSHYKEIYIGHTPTTNYDVFEPMHAANVWNIDTGAAFKGKVTAIDIDTKAFVQSDALPTLYPNEKGRNK